MTDDDIKLLDLCIAESAGNEEQKTFINWRKLKIRDIGQVRRNHCLAFLDMRGALKRKKPKPAAPPTSKGYDPKLAHLVVQCGPRPLKPPGRS